MCSKCSTTLPPDDLDHVLAHTEGLWEQLRGRRIFITGGTGFFGRWLVESFLRANEKLDLNASAVVLTRKDRGSSSAVSFHRGDMRDFEFPSGQFYAIIHAATEQEFESNVQGTRRVLDFARRSDAQRFLFTSSGAVYGKQPPQIPHLPEEYTGAPDTMDISSGYGQSKRVSEFLCAAYARQCGFGAAIARCFAFVGPGLPLDANYAIGNFIRDALAGGPIRVNGDGTPYRSYLYAADLAVWLWTILLKGESCRPYNVGSEEALTIAEVAAAVAAVIDPKLPVHIAHSRGAACERYVPSTRRAQSELGVRQRVTLDEAIRRTSAAAIE
jgi:dTDP-glucose 4,6-dehydratase